VEIAYRAIKQVFDDLNRLGADFGQALREEDLELPILMEYSKGPKELVLKHNHAWLYYRPLDDELPEQQRTLTFAACFVYFESTGAKWKLSPPGRPELWFIAGEATPAPEGNWAALIRTFFNKDEREHYRPSLALGGQVSFYKFSGEREEWKAVALGYELGEIDSAGALKVKAVKRLKEAALKEGIF
jgi:hypothetical protein